MSGNYFRCNEKSAKVNFMWFSQVGLFIISDALKSNFLKSGSKSEIYPKAVRAYARCPKLYYEMETEKYVDWLYIFNSIESLITIFKAIWSFETKSPHDTLYQISDTIFPSAIWVGSFSHHIREEDDIQSIWNYVLIF